MKWVEMLVTVICAVIASSGFWTYLQKKFEKKDVRSKVLIGLAHDRIVYLGMKYIEQGWISEDDYENLHDYLYLPYKEMGGNGSAERIMREVDKLELRKGKTV